MKNMMQRLTATLCSLCLLVSLSLPTAFAVQTPNIMTNVSATAPVVSTAPALSPLPTYTSKPYVEVNGNQPNFTDAEKTNITPFELYSNLDAQGRCGTAFANVCRELMPTAERGNISSIHPTGWQSNMGWQRCHLIAFCLAGENANAKNLITGTDYFNHNGMLPFENMVADYVKETNNHVLYRVTPYFTGKNLVASGVEMEGWSVEDKGEGICFHVYAFNVQPDKVINYATGEVTDAQAKSSTITLKSKSVYYSGQPVSVAKATVEGSTGKVTYTYYTDSTCKTKTTAQNSGASGSGKAPVKVGTYYVKATVAADSKYKAATSKAVKVTIKKATPKISVTTLSKSYTTTQTQKAACSFSLGLSSPAGSVACKKSSGSSALSVSSAGKVTVKKGTAAGTYTAKVTLSTKANSGYLATSVTKTVTVTVTKPTTSTSGVSGSTKVYVSTAGKIHLKSNCSGMKNYTTTTYSKAIAKNYTKCKNCF